MNSILKMTNQENMRQYNITFNREHYERKYIICKSCDKKISRNNYKSHFATHLN